LLANWGKEDSGKLGSVALLITTSTLSKSLNYYQAKTNKELLNNSKSHLNKTKIINL
jgi:hypothetical protein